MSVSINELSSYINSLLNSDNIKDYGPNGLQVQGKEYISTIVSGVSASQALIDESNLNQADCILVHHGIFWNKSPQPLTGYLYNRVNALIKNNINLLAYHLPLDVHEIYGNNKLLGDALGVNITKRVSAGGVDNLLYIGNFSEEITDNQLLIKLENCLKRSPQYICGGREKIKTIAWCSGAGQDFIDICATYNVDAYISGEVSERTFHMAKELGISYFCAGHHATEIFGVMALGEHLADRYGITHKFINIHNPI